MLKTLIKQILNRKKHNIWITIELLLVFCLVWYIVDYFFVYTYNRSLPSFRQLKNTYEIVLKQLPDEHPSFEPAESTPEALLENFRRVIRKIEQSPEIESVCITAWGALPGIGGMNFPEIRVPGDSVGVRSQMYTVSYETDYFDLFNHTKGMGAEKVYIRDFSMEEPNSVVITQQLAELLYPGENALGKQLELGMFSEIYTIKGVIDDVKRFHFLRHIPLVITAMQLNEETISNTYIGIRAKHSVPPAQFVYNTKNSLSPELRIGNYYLKDVISIEEREEETVYAYGSTNAVRTHVILLLFFLFNICLCVIGSFWYRVNQRKEEIGLRRVMGSTTRQIKQSFIYEGLILLAFILPFALFIEAQLIQADLIDTLGRDEVTAGGYLPDKTLLRFTITNLLTLFFLSLVITIGIWFPVEKGTKIEPAEALHYE